MDAFQTDLGFNLKPLRSQEEWFGNDVLCSHLQATPSTNIYFRTLYCCVRREAAPPVSSSFSPSLILSPWPCPLCPLLSLSLCSRLGSSPEVNCSLEVVGPVPSLCIPLPRLMLPWRGTQERGTCPLLLLFLLTASVSLFIPPFFGSFAFQAGWKSAFSTQLSIIKENRF